MQHPVVDLARRQDRVLLIADDLVGELTDRIVDHDVLVGSKVPIQAGAIGFRDGLALDGSTLLRTSERFTVKLSTTVNSFSVGSGLEIEDPVAFGVSLNAVRIRGLYPKVAHLLRRVLLRKGKPDADSLGPFRNHDLQFVAHLKDGTSERPDVLFLDPRTI